MTGKTKYPERKRITVISNNTKSHNSHNEIQRELASGCLGYPKVGMARTLYSRPQAPASKKSQDQIHVLSVRLGLPPRGRSLQKRFKKTNERGQRFISTKCEIPQRPSFSETDENIDIAIISKLKSHFPAWKASGCPHLDRCRNSCMND